MATDGFHNEPFDDGTRTKLELFELYAREWLPVFLASERPRRSEVHLFDFFAGPGTDACGSFGSPLRLLRQIADYRKLPGWNQVTIHVHLFDKSAPKIQRLEEKIAELQLHTADVKFDIRSLSFEDAFAESTTILADRAAAKLVFIDQFGVRQVTSHVFQTLVAAPTCDFLFFLSSSILHRFHDHPAIKQKIKRPDDPFDVHRAALEYYRDLLPDRDAYFLAPFSIKKGSNIYGLIFGSSHPLGIDKFLRVAWGKDCITGEADFDIDRENLHPNELTLDFAEMRPTKVAHFEEQLERGLTAGQIGDEASVLRLCYQLGVTPKHAEPVLIRLKKAGLINLDFRIPDVRRYSGPRPIRRIP